MSGRERRFLILHGVENRRPPEHWQHWLAEQLRRRREIVLYPQLPDSDNPRLDSWLELVRAELAQLGDGERIVLCHSLAALAWLHLADRLAGGERVHRVLLVSPPSPDVLWPEIAHFAAPAHLEPASIRSASATTRIVSSDNDPYCPPCADHLYAQPLQIPADRIPGGGHLSIDDGYGAWPSVLAWCLDGTAPVVPRP
jgi:serine hydrolase